MFVIIRSVVKPRLAPIGISHDIKTTECVHPAPSSHSMLKKHLTGSSGSVYGLIQGGSRSFISSVRVLYTSPSAMTRTNRYNLSPLPVLCGTKQGCCLRRRLFILSLEPLVQHLRQNALAPIYCTYNIPIYLKGIENSIIFLSATF